MLLIPAAEFLFVEKTNLEYQLFTVQVGKAQVSYSYRALISLNAEIKTAYWMAGLDVTKIWTFQIQECCEGTWHELVEDGDHCISEGHILVVVEVMVYGVHVDDVRAADCCIGWQGGVHAQIFDSDIHDC